MTVPAAPQGWSEPGVEEVAPGIFRIPLPMPGDGLRAVNVYALEDGRGLTLVDGGWAIPEARQALDRALAQLGTTVRSITRILVTHAHRDHYTLAVHLRRETGVPIGLGVGEKPALRVIQGGLRHYQPQLVVLREAGAFELADRLEAHDVPVQTIAEGWEDPDEWLEPGVIESGDRRLRVLATPGHTRGHVVFVADEERILLAGDHVLPHITPSIGFEAVPAASPLRDFLGSLRTIRELPDLRLLPAHGGVTTSTHARVDELVAHHDARLLEMTAALERLGTAPASAVAAAVGWTRRRKDLSDLDDENKMLAILETVAHLRVLAASGTVQERRDPSGVVLYTRPGPPTPAR